MRGRRRQSAVFADIDGHSFWPQLSGEKGEPRQWIYTWYAEEGVPPIREFVATKDYKLYRNGRFFDLKKDPFEDHEPESVADLTGDEAKDSGQAQRRVKSICGGTPGRVLWSDNPTKRRRDREKSDQPQKGVRRQRRAVRNASDE